MRGHVVVFEPLDAVYAVMVRILSHFQLRVERCVEWGAWLERLTAWSEGGEEAEGGGVETEGRWTGIANVSRLTPQARLDVLALCESRRGVGVVLTSVLEASQEVRAQADQNAAQVALVRRPFAPHTLYQALVRVAPEVSDAAGAKALWGLDPMSVALAEAVSLDDDVLGDDDGDDGLDEVDLDIVMSTSGGEELVVSSMSLDDLDGLDELESVVELSASSDAWSADELLESLDLDAVAVDDGDGDAGVLEWVEVVETAAETVDAEIDVADSDDLLPIGASEDVLRLEGAEHGVLVGGGGSDASGSGDVMILTADDEVTGVRVKPERAVVGAPLRDDFGEELIRSALRSRSRVRDGFRASGGGAPSLEPALRAPLSLCSVDRVLGWLLMRSHEPTWRSGLVEVWTEGHELPWSCTLHQGYVWGVYRGERQGGVRPEDARYTDFLPRFGVLARQHLGVRSEEVERAVSAQTRDRLNARAPLPRLGWYLVALGALSVEDVQALLVLQLRSHVDKLRYGSSGFVSYRLVSEWTKHMDGVVSSGHAPFGGPVALGDALGLR